MSTGTVLASARGVASEEFPVGVQAEGNVGVADNDPRVAAPYDPDPRIAFHEAMLCLQRGSVEVQRIMSRTEDFELRQAAIEIQKGAAYILKAALALQETSLFSGAFPVEQVGMATDFALGATLLEQGEVDRAISHLKAAAEQQPSIPEVQKLLGDAFLKGSAHIEAAAAYQRAVTLRPEFPEANNNLAIALLATYDYDRARDVLIKILERDRGLPDEMRRAFRPISDAKPPRHQPRPTASPFRLIDSAAHIRYLAGRGDLDATFLELAEQYQSFATELQNNHDRKPYTPLTDDQYARFGGYYDKMLFYRDAPRFDGSVLNPAIDWKSLEDEYRRTRMLFFNDMLTPEAISRLRMFFLESTVFFKHSEAGFVGSYVTEGFNCSLIFQVISELHERLPNILANRPLNNMWCYRYGPEGCGVRPHNGDGSVTLNFWLTPDEANLTAGGGGMVMYDKEHPAEWDWLKFNMYKDDPAIQDQIAGYLSDANAVTIPYGCNRAVLFHSTLFHKTDPFRFREGYLNSRMNITMLLGKRGQESAALK